MNRPNLLRKICIDEFLVAFDYFRDWNYEVIIEKLFRYFFILYRSIY